MKLRKIKLKNFRGYQRETLVNIDDLTMLIGKNDSGKSSILDALNIFFNEPKGHPEKDDYNIEASGDAIEISCIFDDLPESIVIDESVSTTLQNEYMLNDEKMLEIKKIFPASGKSKVYAVASHPQNENCNDLLSKTNPQLKTIAKQVSVDLTNVDDRINSQLREAIWSTCDDLQLKMGNLLKRRR